jgi:hypothetical protein
MRRMIVCALAAGVAAATVACGFSITGPFQGFDGAGSRLHGSFASELESQALFVAQSGDATGAAADFAGIEVSIEERPSLTAAVGADGKFSIAGVPTGAWTLHFARDGRPIGQMRFASVRSNQEIRIVVAVTSAGEVVLVEEARDKVSFADECPRGAGFWCQNQDGSNPNMTAAEFDAFASGAAALLGSVDALNSRDEIARAVCNTGDQLLRQLASLALNLAAETLSRETALEGEPYPNVGAAFDAAVQAANGGGDRERIKDVLDRINNNQNHEACENGTPDDDSEEIPPGETPPTTGQLTICHIPPGNPANRHTITVGASAWPAHQAHGDTLGPCQ